MLNKLENDQQLLPMGTTAALEKFYKTKLPILMARRSPLVDRYARERGACADDPGLSPLSWLLHDERRSLVHEALRRLPPRDADLLVLKYAEGWSARELADRLGVKTSAIEARLHRARGRLRAELASLATEFAGDAEDNDHDRS